MSSTKSCSSIALCLVIVCLATEAWVDTHSSQSYSTRSRSTPFSPIVSTVAGSTAIRSALDDFSSCCPSTACSDGTNGDSREQTFFKLQGKLLKRLRKACKEYAMLEEGDRIMVCVSGGKDSATLLYLLCLLREQLRINFEIIAVHIDQKQPGYDGTPLIHWMETEFPDVSYHHVEENTYSIVVKKTPNDKSFCTVCSRLRRGILYSRAIELGCNKIALGHHADDALETFMLNMIHGGKAKGMPARYTSKRGSLAVLRPMIFCFEEDIAQYALLKQFPILPCNLCSNQNDLHRPQIKLLLGTLEQFNFNAKQNILNAMGSVAPSHLLDQELRQACGMDPVTGIEVGDDEQETV
jgi:tRNA 2-thiocytidine biosynthesis protein TtcA